MVSFRRKSPLESDSPKIFWSILAIATLVGCRAAAAQVAPDYRPSRYTIASPLPDGAQADPLESVVQIRFPRAQVTSVGDAVTYLLLRSGYRLAPSQTLSEQVRQVLALPLPEVHRQLGPCSVRAALSVLLGPPFVLSVDPTQRAVSYRLDGPSVASVTATAGGHEVRRGDR